LNMGWTERKCEWAVGLMRSWGYVSGIPRRWTWGRAPATTGPKVTNGPFKEWSPLFHTHEPYCAQCFMGQAASQI